MMTSTFTSAHALLCIDTMTLQGGFRDHHQASALGCSRRRCSHHAGHD